MKSMGSLGLSGGLALALIGCGGSGVRTAADMKALSLEDFQAWAPVQVAPARVQAVVAHAGEPMGIYVDEESKGVGDPWVFYRGVRLNTGAVYYRVDVRAVTGRPNEALVSVYALPAGRLQMQSDETLNKTRELAFRIVTLALASEAQ